MMPHPHARTHFPHSDSIQRVGGRNPCLQCSKETFVGVEQRLIGVPWKMVEQHYGVLGCRTVPAVLQSR
ncbi:hypothetical protein SDC9_181393 [bioreactor metagenome]|uniref:Uncharacterized protein n=1 Tax=bioreactor metagenome TaxID=1076179 RepID=A0A645H4F7_9ZZZZ